MKSSSRATRRTFLLLSVALTALIVLFATTCPASADDTTPPSVTDVSATPTGTYGAANDLPTVTFKATVTDTGSGASGVNPSTVQVLVAEYNPNLYDIEYATLSNGGSGSVYTGTYNLGGFGPNHGTVSRVFKFYFNASDNAGNQGSSTTVPFITQYNDDTPPTLTDPVVTPDTVDSGSTDVSLSVNVADNGTHASGIPTGGSFVPGVEVFRDGTIQNGATLAQTSGSLYTGSYNIYPSGDANPHLWAFTFSADDNAGNYATITRYVQQDGTTTQPAPTLSKISPTETFSGSGVTLTLTGTDFTSSSVVLFDGFVLPATYKSATSLSCAIDGSYLPDAKQVQVQVYNPGPDGYTSAGQTFTINPRLTALALSPSSVASGTSSTGTVTLAADAFTDQTVTLASNNAAATVPASVVVSAGKKTATFPITTTSVTTSTAVTITAKLGSTHTATLTVTPPASVSVQSLSLSPTSVAGGTSSTGTITLTGPAPAGGLAVTQTSSDTSAATLAGTLNIPAGATSAKFKITTYAVSSTQTVTITSSAGGTSKTATLTVTGTGVTITSLSLSPTSVVGGSATSTGTITLSGPAPSGGLAVTQTSSNTAAATLAPTLNIPAGATSAKFKITTYAVSSSQTVTITSSVNGSSKTATLTVTH